ncbi:protein of unknown function [Methylomagnum ishizawai]|uniref:SiaC family regulatory phosphoprotein domain-containing protein n=1 Tax=Methylomagnum ishizawai TaxID=1760988 RepID=A0A1Y6CVX4_9GAMM|nr:biofilm regulation phosphoprotein SiaC [Methylomagnum ishizawai]SMF94798.1 protein of unknown function [Methylomagnum ishizawai]
MNDQSRDLSIDGTQSTPEIRGDWEAGVLILRGDSYPENTFEIFDRVIGWVENFLSDGSRALRVELSLVYLNTSSIRAMIDILDVLEAAHGRGQTVDLRWFYDRRNERVAELAGDFKEDYTFPFQILPLGE